MPVARQLWACDHAWVGPSLGSLAVNLAKDDNTVNNNTLCSRCAGCEKGLAASLRGFRGMVGLEGRCCRTLWEFGEGFCCDPGTVCGVMRGGMKRTDATEDEGHEEVLVCATVAQDVGALKNQLDKFLLRLCSLLQPPKCHSQVDAEETRSRRASSSPSWSSVCLLFNNAPFSFLTSHPGASGTGRTTFVNTLCESEVLAHKVADNPDTAHIEEGIRIKPVNVGTSVSRSLPSYSSNLPFLLELEEDGVRIALTIVDTPGFGDNIDNEFALVSICSLGTFLLTRPPRFQEIVGYLERQYDDILAEESRIKRNPRFRDNRVHALLYFIPPTGHAYVTAILNHVRSTS